VGNGVSVRVAVRTAQEGTRGGRVVGNLPGLQLEEVGKKNRKEAGYPREVHTILRRVLGVPTTTGGQRKEKTSLHNLIRAPTLQSRQGGRGKKKNREFTFRTTLGASTETGEDAGRPTRSSYVALTGYCRQTLEQLKRQTEGLKVPEGIPLNTPY